jgi:predicted hotdog family 3-hydroxylacyl-ACP dehydratase
MRLLDRVVAADETSCVVEWTVPAASPWVQNARLVRVAFLEMAAQAAAVHAALGASGGDAPRMGLVVGVPQFRVLADALPGDTLRATARRVAVFGPMARFDATVDRGPDRLAEGAISVART